jgi:TolA-binding protein
MSGIQDLKWSDLAALTAVGMALLGYAKVSHDQGVLEGNFTARMKQVEDAVVDSKAQIRGVPLLDDQMKRVEDRLKDLSGEIKEQRKDLNDMREKLIEEKSARSGAASPRR